VSLLRVYEKGVFEGFAPQEHATGHVPSVYKTEFDGFDLGANLDLSLDEIAFVLLSVAGTDMGLVGYGSNDGLCKVAVLTMECYVKLDSFTG